MSGNDLIKILIIDDDESVRKSLISFFEDYEFDIEDSESAEEALEKMRTVEYDVAIVDLRLPGMRGEVLIETASHLGAATKYLIHTGSKDFLLTEGLQKLGIKEEHVFYKPMTDLTPLLGGINILLTDKLRG